VYIPASDVTPTSAGTDLDAVRQAYMDALMARDSHAARSVIDRALAEGADPASLDLEVLRAALNAFGELWVDGEVSVAHEHFVTGITEGVMALLASRMRTAPVGGRLALVACPTGERHALGARMIADFLEAEGWEVLALGADTPARDLLDLVDDERPDLVALSVTMPSCLDGALELLGALGTVHPRPCIAVGGAAWPAATRPEGVGVDIVAPDPRELVEQLREKLPPRPEDE
jgi:MerR family transcriptional regulator, light-induced transcriptional regulator